LDPALDQGAAVANPAFDYCPRLAVEAFGCVQELKKGRSG